MIRVTINTEKRLNHMKNIGKDRLISQTLYIAVMINTENKTMFSYPKNF
jgi:hypothetical protein